jgi:hypothetical protein
MYSNWIILCVLCRLAASRVGVKLQFHSDLTQHTQNKLPAIHTVPPDDE